MPKILIIEDDSVLLNILISKFSASNYEVLVAEDGEKGIDQVTKHQPDVIILDLMLPKIDGFGVLKAIRKHSDPKVSKASVVVLSNLWSNKDILQAQALKIDQYYVKANTDSGEVVQSVAKILSERA